MVRAVAAALALALASCERVEVAPVPAAPELSLISPSNGRRVAFDEPFVISGTAIAPGNGTITGVDLVLRGAIDDRSRIEVQGSVVDLAVEITVPSGDHLGPDPVPLEVVLTPEALVLGRIRTGAPRGVLLAVVDRTAPELAIDLSPGLEPPPGFDGAFPPGAPFTLSVRASDSAGGVERISIEAPPALGGPRERAFPIAREAALEVIFVPPDNADVTLVIAAEDGAESTNRAERRLRIRIGGGGVDETAPEIAALDAGEVECRAPATFGAIALDESSGIEHVTIRGPNFEETAFGPSAIDPLALSVRATAIAEGAAGGRITFDAEAEDTFGNRRNASFSRQIVDTHPPELMLAVQEGPLEPGQPLDLMLFGEEACGLIDHVRADLGGFTSTVAIGARALAGTISIGTPEELCVLEPVIAMLELVDLEGLGSETATLALSGEDRSPPRIRINTIVPAGGLAPGDLLAAEIALDDGQTPVRSATVSVSPIGLLLPDPLLSNSGVWPAGGCGDRVERTVPIDFEIPEDVRVAPGGGLRISVEAEDAAGNVKTASAFVPVADMAPPLLSILEPAAGALLLPGELVPLVIEVSDRNGDVASLALIASGPASIGSPGVATATAAVGTSSAVLAFELLVDATTPLGAPIGLQAMAVDEAGASATASVAFSVCGTPAIVAIEPNVGPASGGIDVLVRGSGFARGALLFVGGAALESQAVDSATIARGRIPNGPYPVGPADVSMANDCGIASPSGTLTGGFSFTAP